MTEARKKGLMFGINSTLVYYFIYNFAGSYIIGKYLSLIFNWLRTDYPLSFFASRAAFFGSGIISHGILFLISIYLVFKFSSYKGKKFEPKDIKFGWFFISLVTIFETIMIWDMVAWVGFSNMPFKLLDIFLYLVVYLLFLYYLKRKNKLINN